MPLNVLLCIVMVATQMRADAWKLVKVYRRPFPMRASSIGIWDGVLNALNYAAIFNGIALVSMQVHHLDGPISSLAMSHPAYTFVVFQNLFVAIKLLYHAS